MEIFIENLNIHIVLVASILKFSILKLVTPSLVKLSYEGVFSVALCICAVEKILKNLKLKNCERIIYLNPNNGTKYTYLLLGQFHFLRTFV